MRRWQVMIALCCGWAFLQACGGADPENAGGNTSWLGACHRQSDCHEFGKGRVCQQGECVVPVGVGSTSPDGGSVDTPPDGKEPVSAEPTSGTVAEELQGDWDGYAEAHNFERVSSAVEDSDRIRLSLNGDGSGWLRVGDDPLFALASDPDDFYPPGTGQFAHVVNIVPGVQYAITDLRITKQRIQFSVQISDAWSSWCELQSPVLDANGEYGCIEALGGGGGTGACHLDIGETEVPVGCGKLYMCSSNFCSCSESGCEASNEWGTIDVDATFSEDTLQGTLALGRLVTVHLTRH